MFGKLEVKVVLLSKPQGLLMMSFIDRILFLCLPLKSGCFSGLQPRLLLSPHNHIHSFSNIHAGA